MAQLDYIEPLPRLVLADEQLWNAERGGHLHLREPGFSARGPKHSTQPQVLGRVDRLSRQASDVSLHGVSDRVVSGVLWHLAGF